MTGGRKPIYRFLQFEVPWALGPTDSRYVIREHAGEDPHHVLVLTSVPARARRFLPGTRSKGAPPEPEPAELSLTRVTIVDAARVDDDAARAWLRSVAGDGAQDAIAGALRHLNGALRAHRVATADPTVRELSADQALVIRAGYGVGYDVAEGRWTEARELRPSKQRRRRDAALRPQERLAALLGGRDAVLACEDMALRARLDLDHGRDREAALQAHLALEAAVSELQAWRTMGGIERRLGDLESRRDGLAAAANEALRGGLDPETVEVVREGLERVEAALRARSASATY